MRRHFSVVLCHIFAIIAVRCARSLRCSRRSRRSSLLLNTAVYQISHPGCGAGKSRTYRSCSIRGSARKNRSHSKNRVRFAGVRENSLNEPEKPVHGGNGLSSIAPIVAERRGREAKAIAVLTV